MVIMLVLFLEATPWAVAMEDIYRHLNTPGTLKHYGCAEADIVEWVVYLSPRPNAVATMLQLQTAYQDRIMFRSAGDGVYWITGPRSVYLETTTMDIADATGYPVYGIRIINPDLMRWWRLPKHIKIYRIKRWLEFFYSTIGILLACVQVFAWMSHPALRVLDVVLFAFPLGPAAPYLCYVSIAWRLAATYTDLGLWWSLAIASAVIPLQYTQHAPHTVWQRVMCAHCVQEGWVCFIYFYALALGSWWLSLPIATAFVGGFVLDTVYPDIRSARPL